MPNTNDTAPKPRAKTQPRQAQPAVPAPAPVASEPDTALFDAADPAPAAVEPAPSSEASEATSEGPASPEPAAIEQAPTSKPDPAPGVQPEQQQAVDEAPTGAVPEPPADPAPAAVREPSDFPKRVRLGQVEGLLYRVPLQAVQLLLSGSADRIEVGRSSPSIAQLQERMRVTEGQCAPVVMSQKSPEDLPLLLAGVESVSCALNLGLTEVYVLTIPEEEAGQAQRHLADNAQGLPLSSKTDCYQLVR
jgi:hypothetical protein